MKPDQQMTLELGRASLAKLIPDAGRQKCIALLGRILLAVIDDQTGKESHER